MNKNLTKGIKNETVETDNSFVNISSAEYTAKHIKALKGSAAIRQNAPMYVGDPESGEALHRIVYEVVDNSVDEYLAGFGNYIKVHIEKDGFITIVDEGRGLPTDMHTEGISAMEVILTQMHAGGKFDKKLYEFSAGTHGLGVVLTNALSENFEARSFKGGQEFYMSFKEGCVFEKLVLLGSTTKTGTLIKFLPDKKIFFNNIDFSHEILEKRFEETAFLNKGLKIDFIDDRIETTKSFFFEGGIKDFVAMQIEDKDNLLEEILYIKEYFKNPTDQTRIEVQAAFTWSKTSFKESIRSFCNTVYQDQGGTHETGFKSAISKVITKYIESNLKKNLKFEISGDDTRLGILAVLAIKLQHTSYASQTKNRLTTGIARTAVENIISNFFSTWLDHNPKKAKVLIDQVVHNAETQYKIRNIKETAKFESGIRPRIFLKVADCQRNHNKPKELFIVEGEGAAGSVKQARNSEYQAVFSIRGKIRNVEKSQIETIIKFEEIRDLFTVLGTGMGDAFDVKKMRYERIIILTDADLDGYHISCLLLTLFFRYARDLIFDGRLFIAQPPLYKIEQGKNIHYVQNEEEMNKILLEEFQKEHYASNINGEKIDLLPYINQGKKLISILRTYFSYKDINILSYIVTHADFQQININTLENLISLLNNYKPGTWKVKIETKKSYGLPIEFLEKLNIEDLIAVQQPRGSLLSMEEISNDINISEDIEESVTPFTETINTEISEPLDEEFNFIEEKEEYEILEIEFTSYTEKQMFYIHKFYLEKILETFSEKLDFPIKIFHKQKDLGTIYHYGEIVNLINTATKKNLHIQRYKGIGEMDPSEVKPTIMDINNRAMKQVNIHDVELAENVVEIFMGKDVTRRKKIICDYARVVKNVDI